jgi:ferric-dicitrate binding protein FerR (iron transport regulator)
MTDRHDVLYCRIHDFVTAELETSATPMQRREFVRLVCDDPAARQIYVAYMQELASLRWSYANHPMDLLDPMPREATSLSELAIVPQPSRSLTLSSAAMVVAATLLIALSAAWWFADQGQSHRHQTASSHGDRLDDAGGGGLLSGETWPPLPGERGSVAGDLARPAGVATVTRVIDARWEPGSSPAAELSRLRTGQTLNLVAGQVELIFDTGVEVILEGRTHFEIRSAESAYSRCGSISARVGDEARGFTIETPNARVIDLGTQFGVSISESGETEVAVFRGVVDLALDPAGKDTLNSSPNRLNQGEALRINKNGELKRMVSIASDHFPSAAANRLPHTGRLPLIAEVRDNLRDPESRKFYQLVRSGLQEDAPAFVDRDHQWNGVTPQGIPAELLGAEYVMPFNDDKSVSDLEVTLLVARPVVLYIFLSDSVPIPKWLTADFVETGQQIGLDEAPSRYHPAASGRRKLDAGPGVSVDTTFSIWKREIRVPSSVVLGAVDRPTQLTGYNMYGIAAVPLP